MTRSIYKEISKNQIKFRKSNPQYRSNGFLLTFNIVVLATREKILYFMCIVNNCTEKHKHVPQIQKVVHFTETILIAGRFAIQPSQHGSHVMSTTDYQPLNSQQIALLKQNGCTAEDWSRILVAPPFLPDRFFHVEFIGDIRIDRQTETVLLPDGNHRPAGIHHARLRNITIGTQCYIANIGNELANLTIGNSVIIIDVGTITCQGKTSFGNGHPVRVLNEAGGREIKITAITSAQMAYITALYRHNPALIGKCHQLADHYATRCQSSVAPIGDSAIVMHTGEINNVAVGPGARIIGAQLLHEGTIVSQSDCHTTVGSGVIADNFIFQRGSHIRDGATLHSCLIGEGSLIGNRFHADHCVFFANSEGLLSEACSIFGGPFTVTHHRSTLLIAGMVSFFNAGSGTNQSNHMYKLGPVHQGVLERGCKTGSFSYLLWPCRVGAFTVILGKHFARFDTSKLPFSYINEYEGRSAILPGYNFYTTGTYRDAYKWKQRDHRSGDHLDMIIFDVLTPYTVQRVIDGLHVLTELQHHAPRQQTFMLYQGIAIKRQVLSKSRQFYQRILDKYFGDVIIRHYLKKNPSSIMELFDIHPAPTNVRPEWLDVAGLVCQKQDIDKMILQLLNGTISSLSEWQQAFRHIYERFDSAEWNWCQHAWYSLTGQHFHNMTKKQWSAFWDTWKTAARTTLEMIAQDARKEFDNTSKISFGIDGETEADFKHVRGTMETNTFLQELNEEVRRVEAYYEKMCKLTQTD